MSKSLNLKFTMDVVVIGSCMIDFVCFAERRPNPGETVVGNKFILGHGGKGGNQCVTAAKLGAKCALIARLGNDSFGEGYLKQLIKNGVNVENVSLTNKVSSGVAQITVAKNGENSIVIVPGANYHLLRQDVKKAENYILNSKVVLLQFETPLETTIEVIKFIRANKGRSKIIVNAAPAIKDIDPVIHTDSDIFCMNEGEAEAMSGVPVGNIEDAKKAVEQFFSFGCSTVIITLGAKGAVFGSQNGEISHVSTAEVSPVDTTGAGDAFLGGLGYFISKFPQLSLEESIRRACAVATISVTKEGTQTSYPTFDELPSHLFSDQPQNCN